MNIIAMKRSSGETVTNPSGATTIQPGDILITVGTEEEINKLEELLNAQRTV